MKYSRTWHFLQDFDIDSALKDIRHEWEKEKKECFLEGPRGEA
jgi:hypothetical protein